MFGFLLAATTIGLIAGAASLAKSHSWPHAAECRWTQWRLPPGAVPAHYNLTWDVDLESEQAGVSGSVDVRFVATAPLRCAVLHAAPSVDITKAAVTVGEHTTPLTVSKSITRVEATQQIIVALPSHGLPTDAIATLSLSFAFPLKPGLSGLYLSTWTDHAANKTHRLALTQFEANAARAAVPCFDEPALKARWTVNVAADKAYTVLTNMPIVR